MVWRRKKAHERIFFPAGKPAHAHSAGRVQLFFRLLNSKRFFQPVKTGSSFLLSFLQHKHVPKSNGYTNLDLQSVARRLHVVALVYQVALTCGAMPRETTSVSTTGSLLFISPFSPERRAKDRFSDSLSNRLFCSLLFLLSGAKDTL